MADPDAEEERLNRMLAKKSDEAFERTRREALQKYQNKTGRTDFPPPREPEKKSFKPQPAPVPTEPTAPKASSTDGDWKEEYARKQKEERRREEEEEARRKATLAALGGEAHDNLQKWKEEQELQEQQLKKRLEEEDRKKRELIQGMKAASLEEQRKRDEEARANAPPPVIQAPSNICEGCKKEFRGVTDIYIVNEKRYCQACSKHALTERSGGPKCAHCKLPLEMAIATAAGRKYHPECLRCADCGGSISAGFRQRGKDFVCVSCCGAFGLGKR